VEESFIQGGFQVLGYRHLPVDRTILGKAAAKTEPWVEQIFLSHPDKTPEAIETELYVVRKKIEHQVLNSQVYFCSLSTKTIVYKGMLRSSRLADYYLDLKDSRYKIQYGLWHRRFSTNTLPKWPLAQPFRMLGHNGEINTIQGNYNWLRAREAAYEHPTFGTRMNDVLPTLRGDNSDSGNLDCYVELLCRTNRELPESLMMAIPEAYNARQSEEFAEGVHEFYDYWGSLQEPWDGPALVAFCDGRYMGATLDRNGLRPARYFRLKDGTSVVSSEVGVLGNVQPDEYEMKGRLGPGQMVSIDLISGELIEDMDIKAKMAQKKPYKAWLGEFRSCLERMPPVGAEEPLPVQKDLLRWELAMGYSAEDIDMVVEGMAMTGREPTFCMGNDKPLAVLSERPHVLFDYFSQRFAQVTNPAIDPYREALVMSLSVFLGRQGNMLAETPTTFKNPNLNRRMLMIDDPIINERELDDLRGSDLLVVELTTRYKHAGGPQTLAKAINELCYYASNAVKNGAELIILSDNTPEDDGEIHEDELFIPPMLAVGAVHHYLIRQGNRTQVSLVVNTGQCWSTHHFACLIGYGASAVCAHVALAHIRNWHASKKGQTRSGGQTVEECQMNFKNSILGGLRKIMSKMGISVLECYRGAQIFQCLGLSDDVVSQAFDGTPSLVQGMTIEEIANESMLFHKRAFPELEPTGHVKEGWYNYKKGQEYHMNNPQMSKALHDAVREHRPLKYKEYKELVIDERPVSTLRDLLSFGSDRQPITEDEVEPALDICSRFCTGGMSLGALSREAHEVIALGMNRVGGKSNSGEGGEDPVRFKPVSDVDEDGHSPTFPHLNGLRNGDSASSATKQIASGRFGVTPAYLRSAQQLEIKIAQGAKPGEGGQLPGKKIDKYIASLRRSVEGVELISPPPHHDIYSIEDLAQLIYDCHHVSPDAKVSVKLVASSGIGTVAAGVAKANADIIQVSGHDGGTGASPLSSIMHAGGPWELGLVEVHNALVRNGLRDKVILRVDGGLKTGWDIVVSAMMGADEFGFGSIAMIAEGCVMARICHTNKCPVGIATQLESLRKKFPGTPAHVENFMLLMAEEVRLILAALGYRSIDEIIGRRDLLQPRNKSNVRRSIPSPPLAVSEALADTHTERYELTKTTHLDLGFLLAPPTEDDDFSWCGVARRSPARSNGAVLDDEVLADESVKRVIESNSGIAQVKMPVCNEDRSVGGRIAGEIAERYGDFDFRGKIRLHFEGSAGQSFGVFNSRGVELTLVGESNDYLGKGMAGGSIVVLPPKVAGFKPQDNVIVGNTCLYGATGGEVFISGRAGERFAVRNTRGHAVIEGCGDHLGEYMTGGAVVVLGRTGKNMAAGMSGGVLYLHVPGGGDIQGLCHNDNKGNVFEVERASQREEQLRSFVQRHADLTSSEVAQDLLSRWDEAVGEFRVIVPASEQAPVPVAPELEEEELEEVETPSKA